MLSEQSEKLRSDFLAGQVDVSQFVREFSKLREEHHRKEQLAYAALSNLTAAQAQS